jgi:hypothetical protein
LAADWSLHRRATAISRTNDVQAVAPRRPSRSRHSCWSNGASSISTEAAGLMDMIEH